ncbi:pentapeptide repeat-containing protein [Vibrio caribbeanicus]|uniref:pentapeptide repeat-containing protein n=1 Tax=Vibrio caribbeanicus TaxID=701175 RepID=UPI0030D71E4A
MNIIDNDSYFARSFDKGSVSEENFQGIEFEECHFTDCDFSNACFQDCRFINCTFKSCNLSLTKFPKTRFMDISFSECKLIGIDWTNAEWPVYHNDFGIKYYRCILNDASYYGLTLQELVFEECTVRDADFREGDFSKSSFIACELNRSLFIHTNLENVDFSDSANFTINVLQNRVTGAKFSRYEALNLLESLDIDLVD